MRVLRVIDGVVTALRLCCLNIKVNRRRRAARCKVPTRSVDADLFQQLIKPQLSTKAFNELKLKLKLKLSSRLPSMAFHVGTSSLMLFTELACGLGVQMAGSRPQIE